MYLCFSDVLVSQLLFIYHLSVLYFSHICVAYVYLVPAAKPVRVLKKIICYQQ